MLSNHKVDILSGEGLIPITGNIRIEIAFFVISYNLTEDQNIGKI